MAVPFNGAFALFFAKLSWSLIHATVDFTARRLRLIKMHRDSSCLLGRKGINKSCIRTQRVEFVLWDATHSFVKRVTCAFIARVSSRNNFLLKWRLRGLSWPRWRTAWNSSRISKSIFANLRNSPARVSLSYVGNVTKKLWHKERKRKKIHVRCNVTPWAICETIEAFSSLYTEAKSTVCRRMYGRKWSVLYLIGNVQFDHVSCARTPRILKRARIRVDDEEIDPLRIK